MEALPAGAYGWGRRMERGGMQLREGGERINGKGRGRAVEKGWR